jgi:hypothetical protein
MKTLNDLTAPATPVRKLLEKDVQKKCVDWARARGYWARKFSSISQRSVPDYLFAHAAYGKFAVEFKAPGKEVTDAQAEEILAMRDAGWLVCRFDNVSLFRGWVEAFEMGRAGPI